MLSGNNFENFQIFIPFPKLQSRFPLSEAFSKNFWRVRLFHLTQNAHESPFLRPVRTNGPSTRRRRAVSCRTSRPDILLNRRFTSMTQNSSRGGQELAAHVRTVLTAHSPTPRKHYSVGADVGTFVRPADVRPSASHANYDRLIVAGKRTG